MILAALRKLKHCKLFFFLFLLSDPLSFFSHFTLLSVSINTTDERVQIEKCGKFKRNKDSNSKDKAQQT